jgi:type III secretory pathway component EscU
MKNTMTVGIILTILGICTSILGISIIFKNQQIQPEDKTIEPSSQKFSDIKSDKEILKNMLFRNFLNLIFQYWNGRVINS